MNRNAPPHRNAHRWRSGVADAACGRARTDCSFVQIWHIKRRQLAMLGVAAERRAPVCKTSCTPLPALGRTLASNLEFCFRHNAPSLLSDALSLWIRTQVTSGVPSSSHRVTAVHPGATESPNRREARRFQLRTAPPSAHRWCVTPCSQPAGQRCAGCSRAQLRLSSLS